MRPITLCSGQWTDIELDKLCEDVSKMGYDGLELACWGGHVDIEKAADDDTYVNERLDILKKNNLKVFALSTHLIGQCIGDAYAYDERLNNFLPKNLHGKPKEIKEWAKDMMIKSAKACKNFGCYVSTSFMGSPIWKFWYSYPQTTGKMIEEGFDIIVREFTPILDEYLKLGVKFALEVHPTEIAFDYYTAKKLLEKFNYHKALGFNFDPSHLLWQGIDPALFIRDFGDRIFHVHMKDVAVHYDGRAGVLGSHLEFGDLRRAWNFRSLGHGHVNFEEIIRELNAIGYNGPLSVEWEDNGIERFYGAKESLEFVKKINFAPSDISFDASIKN